METRIAQPEDPRREVRYPTLMSEVARAMSADLTGQEPERSMQSTGQLDLPLPAERR